MIEKNKLRELTNIKANVEIVEERLDKMFEELMGRNRDLYTRELTKNEKYKRAIEVSAQLLECYKLKNELIKQSESI